MESTLSVKLLNCIISYNRYCYLKNTIESLIEYFRFGDTLIVDDGSDDQHVVDYLSELESRAVHVIRHQPWASQPYHVFGHNDLYENMDVGVTFAIDHGYDYIHFVQDDVQFMWHDQELLTRVEYIFQTLPDAAQVSNLFYQAIFAGIEARRPEPVPHANCYHSRPHGMSAMGIVPVNLLKKHNFRFGNGDENTNSGWWRRQGYRAYALHAPIVALVPWPSVFYRGRLVAEGCRPVNKYYLKPLESHEIKRLLSRPLEEIPYTEDYCLPWGWSCPTPYWSIGETKEYKRLLSKGKSRTRFRQALRRLLPDA